MHLLFVLDGTLTDSREGIVRCIQHALAEVGAFVRPLEELTHYVGPPLPASFAALLGTTDVARVDAALAAYRRRFERVGMLENRLFPGIAEALEECAGAGHGICVVSAKPRVYSRRILKHFAIASLIRGVYGPGLGDRAYTKESLIREACLREQVQGNRAVMIGDRAEDVLGAKRNGVDAVAVTWGYGEREELEAARPSCIVTSCDELLDYIRRAG